MMVCIPECLTPILSFNYPTSLHFSTVATVTLNVVKPMMFSGSLQVCADERLRFRLELAGAVMKAPNQQCVISVMTEDGSAVGEC